MGLGTSLTGGSCRDISAVGGVDVLIDTAYDTVKKVADNLDDLLKLLKEFDMLGGIYLGERIDIPTTRNDSTPLENGDHFLNTSDRLLYVYLAGGWTFHAIFYTQTALDEAVGKSPFHTWFAYADDDTGTGISLSPTNKTYLGVASNRPSTTVSITDASVFTWVRAQGNDGTSHYFHVAYSDSADGTTNFNNTSGAYIGTYSDTAVTDSTLPADYTWVRILGNTGNTGDTGLSGDTGNDGVSAYMHIAYADSADGITNFNDTTGQYIGVYSDNINVASTSPARYNWSLIRGTTGTEGTTPVRGVDYFDGVNGQYTTFIFLNSIDAPPTPTGGYFDGTNETIPPGWADDATIPSSALEKAWVSKGIYKEVDGVWPTIIWSTPSIFFQKGDKPVYGVDYITADGAYVSFIFINAVNQPDVPVGGIFSGIQEDEVFPISWFDNPTATVDTEITWVSKRTYVHDGTDWSAPAWGEVIKFYERGDDGYTPVRGVDYFDGIDGAFVSFIFRNAIDSIQLATPVGGSFNGTDEIPPTSWTDDPTNPSGTDVIWVSKGRWRNDGNSWVQTGWSTPVIFVERGISSAEIASIEQASADALAALEAAAAAQLTADGRTQTFHQDEPPTEFNEFDLWYDTDDRDTPYIAINGEWLLLRNFLAELIVEVRTETISRKELERTVFDVVADYANWRNIYENRTKNSEILVDASVYIDPSSGLIINRAYAYSDDKFTEAQILIDGTNATIVLQATKIEATEDSIIAAEGRIDVEAGRIDLRATYTEITAEIAGAIESLTPAYSWQFNSSAENFTGQTSWNAAGYLVQAAGTPAVTPTISLDTSTDAVFRIRVRQHVAGTWNGSITFTGGSIAVPSPSAENVWEIIQIDATNTTGYTGTLTSLSFDLGDCDIDYIEVGKRGANDQALADITLRTTSIEQDIDAGTGTMAVYATTTWVSSLDYQTSSSVNTLIDTFNTTYSISASLQSFIDNDTLVKANSASTWVDGANATIRNQVIAYNAEEDSIDSKLNIAQTSIDAVRGQIESQITSLSGLTIASQATDLGAVMTAYAIFLMNNDIALGDTKFAYANETLTALANESSSVATQLTSLFANYNNASASIDVLNKAIVTQYQATATVEEVLRVEMVRGDVTSIAQAEEYTRASIGYCIDANSAITNEEDAVTCFIAGNTWVPNPLAEVVRAVRIKKGDNYASIADIRQVFETINGALIARGGMLTDVNGNVSGFINTNTGATSSFDIVTELFRIGVYDTDDATFLPLLTLDRANKRLNITANLILGDGFVVNGQSDIQALDGSTIYKEYQYANVSGGTYHNDLLITDYYRRERTVTISPSGTVNGAWTTGVLFRVDGYTPVKGVDYFDGIDGSFISYVYKLDGGEISGGSFDGTTESVPTGWSDNPVYSSIYRTYVSSTKYIVDGTGNWTNSGWSAPVIWAGVDGDTGDTGLTGDTGERGAGMFTKGTPSGDWLNSDAVLATGGVAVTGDIVTIYKTSDLTYSPTTKKYDGTNWNTPELVIHGDMLVTGTVDGNVLVANTKIRSPILELVGSTHMRISSSIGFGTSNQFIEWFGPLNITNNIVNYSELSESNAITYLKTDGTAYFGGAIISGALSTSLTTSSLSDTAEITIGPYGSNGGIIALSCSVTMSTHKFYTSANEVTTAPSIPTCSIILEENVSGVWYSRQPADYVGTSNIESWYDFESRLWQNTERQDLVGSFTFTDNKQTTVDRIYRNRMTARANLYTVGVDSRSQKLSINSQEG